MVRIEFTSQLTQHVKCEPLSVSANTLREVLEQAFEANEGLRGYIVDDQGAIRKHVAVFVNNQLVRDRVNIDFQLESDAEVYVMQALSGG